MTIKYYTHNNPPLLGGEVFKKESLTRQSDFIDIKDTIARFSRAGLINKPNYSPLTPDEKEELFDSLTDMELMDADLVEQKNFVDQINQTKVPVSEKEEKEVVEEKGAEAATAD